MLRAPGCGTPRAPTPARRRRLLLPSSPARVVRKWGRVGPRQPGPSRRAAAAAAASPSRASRCRRHRSAPAFLPETAAVAVAVAPPPACPPACLLARSQPGSLSLLVKGAHAQARRRPLSAPAGGGGRLPPPPPQEQPGRGGLLAAEQGSAQQQQTQPGRSRRLLTRLRRSHSFPSPGCAPGWICKQLPPAGMFFGAKGGGGVRLPYSGGAWSCDVKEFPLLLLLLLLL